MYNNSIESLKILIDARIFDLQKYSSNDNSKAYYISLENKLIQELVNIYNVVSALKYYDIWINIEDKMKKLEKIDDQIHGHRIEFRLKQKGNNFTLITCNPFES